MALSRRAFLAGCAGCVAASAATANARRRQPADLSTSVGFPDPARHWRGESSVAAAIRAGQFFRAPSIPPPISCGEVFDAGRVGAVNLSWWGPDSFSNGSVDRIMDVFRAYDIRVTFHLEPHLVAQSLVGRAHPRISQSG